MLFNQNPKERPMKLVLKMKISHITCVLQQKKQNITGTVYIHINGFDLLKTF